MRNRSLRNRFCTALTALTAGLLVSLNGGAASGASLAAPGGSWRAADAGSATYSASQTIPVPPASTYGGSGGGDGWALAVGPTSVFNVFHHSASLTVACHLQSDASNCWDPRTVTDATGGSFATSGHPGLWFDATTNRLYVYATRGSDGTAGVVCVDTVIAGTAVSPFCGFTALTAVGDAPLDGGISNVSEPVATGSKWYAFNYVQGEAAGASKNALMCFDLKTFAACAGQPFAVPLGAGQFSNSSYPEAQASAIGGRVVVAATTGGNGKIGCFDPGTGSGCTGSWPVAANGYPSSYGAPFPMLDAAGTTKGLCLPTGADPCFDLSGVSVPTPAGLAAAIPATEGWNGGAVTVGPRVYVPNGNTDQVHCYSWASDAGCPSFPKSFSGLGFLYTVNPDPARPTCLWVNADYGSQQIQNFDAYTGGACGAGPIRVLASSFVVASVACQPATYTSLQVMEPPRTGYSTGTVAFQDGDAHPIAGAADGTLDATGTVALADRNLSTGLGLPQFLITLNNPAQAVGEVKVNLVWTGVNDPSCVKPGTVVTPGPGGPPASGECGDAVFLAAAGSGQHFKTGTNLWVSRELKTVYDNMKTTAGGKKIGVRVLNYPAPSVDVITAGLNKIKSKNPVDYLNQVHAKAASNLSRYLAGKNQGVTEMWAQYASVRAECPAGTKIVVGGYSQGAMVAHEFLNQLAATNDSVGKSLVVGAALIADPERTQDWGLLDFGDAPLSSYGVCDLISDVVSCTAPAPLATVAAPFAGRTVSVCDDHDAVCATSQVIPDLVVTGLNAKERAVVLERAKAVHGRYASQTATKTAGKWIGRIVAR
ncbi:MAG TPA: cutinase family protein [Kineosporiaceae bacterium]|nr:cutinase family protein [Kineosporiaceae bacterium]